MRPTGGIPLRVLVPLLVAALLVGGCDAGEKDEPAPPPVETADPLPKLPREWKPHGNPRAGFAIGVPPHWSVRDRRRSSLLRSPDRLVAVAVSADRTDGGLEVPVDDFATRVTDALPNLKRLEVGKPRPFRARYDAASVSATGRSAKGDVPQRLQVVVERREGFASYTIVVARNAKHGGKEHRDEVRRMLRSLRGRPARG